MEMQPELAAFKSITNSRTMAARTADDRKWTSREGGWEEEPHDTATDTVHLERQTPEKQQPFPRTGWAPHPVKG